MKDQFVAQLKNKPQDSPEAANDSTSAPLIEVKSQLKANDLEIANRQRAIQSLQAEIGNYQARLNNTPVREQELTDLNRDYEQLKAYYDQLLNKKNQAGLAANFSREQQGDRFTMQDPPSKPTKPFSPNRFRLGCLGLFAGLAMGLVVAGGQSSWMTASTTKLFLSRCFRPRFWSKSQLCTRPKRNRTSNAGKNFLCRPSG